MLNFSVFCPNCGTYLSTVETSCTCGWQRPRHEKISLRGQPLWTSPTPSAPARGKPVVSGSHVCIGWGERLSNGGLAVFDRWTGEKGQQYNTACSVEEGILLAGERLYYTTLGFLDSGGEVFCIDPETGKMAWQKPQTLRGGASGAPLLLGDRLLVATTNGWLYTFDAHSGHPCPDGCWQIQSGFGKLWLIGHGGDVIIANQDGSLQIFSIHHGRAHFSPLGSLGAKLNCSPTIWRNNLFAGTADGRLLRFDLKTKKTSPLADDLRRVVVSPVTVDGQLIVCGHDRSLRILSLPDGEEVYRCTFEHSVTLQPQVFNGLVFTAAEEDLDDGSRCGCLCALDPQQTKPVARYPIPNGACAYGGLAVSAEGILYFGDESGTVHAVPWHMGDYAFAGQHLQRQGMLLDAACAYDLARAQAVTNLERQQLIARACACLEQADLAEYAARLLERIGEDKVAADTFCKAGEAWRTRPNGFVEAAEFYQQASNLYWQLDLHEAEAQASQRAARLASLPNLRIKAINTPQLEQYQTVTYTFRVENFGRSGAGWLRFKLGGSILGETLYNVAYFLEPNDYFDIQFPIQPTRLQDILWIEVHYAENEQRKNPFLRRLEIPLTTRPAPQVIKLDGIINSNVKIINKSGHPVAVEMIDVYKGEIEIEQG